MAVRAEGKADANKVEIDRIDAEDHVDQVARDAAAAAKGVADSAQAEATTNAGNISDIETEVNSNRLGLAGLTDAFPDPTIPDHTSEAKNYELHVPATRGRAQWVESEGLETLLKHSP